MRRPRVALLALLVLPLAACGGGGSKVSSGTTGGGEVAPKSAPFLVRVDTSFASDQWRAFQALLAKFPDGKDVLAKLGGQGVDFDQDVKPALGPETDIFALTQADAKNDVFLALTQPRNDAKLDSLLAKGTNHPVSEEIAGWRVISDKRETIDRLKQARNGGTLADSQKFKDAMDALPADRVAAFYADGAAVARTAAKETNTGTGAGPVPGTGRIGWLSGALGAEDRGFTVDLRVQGDELEQTPFTAELPAQLPAGVSLLIDVKGLDATLEDLKRSPTVQQRLSEAEKSFGGLIDRAIALFKGETAFVVRPGAAGKSEVSLVVAVEDETQAQATIDQIATLLGALGQQSPQPVQIAGVSAQKLALGKTSLFYAIFDGKLVISNAETGISGLKTGQRLESSQAWHDAADAAGLPDQTAGIVYADVTKLLPALEATQRSSSGQKPLSPMAKRNLEHVSSVMLYGTRDGDVLAGKGFVFVR